MKTCRDCGQPIKGITINGENKRPKHRTRCFSCVPFGTSIYSTPSSPLTREKQQKRLESKRKSSKKYYDRHGYLGTIRYRKRRDAIISISGGSCQLCGYSRCTGSLTFHHLDPSTKETGTSAREFQKSIDFVLNELKKTVLICQNCHHEVHHSDIHGDLSHLNAELVSCLSKIKSSTWKEFELCEIGMPL